VYNSSLANHSIPIFSLLVSLRIDQVFFSTKVLFDANSQKAVCASIDALVGLGAGSTVFLGAPLPPEHMDEAADVGMHSILVNLRTNVRTLPPSFKAYLSSAELAVKAVGALILSSVASMELTGLLRSQATLLNAPSLLRANVSSGNVTYLEAPPAALGGLTVTAMGRINSTIVAAIVVAALVAALLLLLVASGYFKAIEGGERKDLYIMASTKSSDNLLDEGVEDRFRVETLAYPEGRRIASTIRGKSESPLAKSMSSRGSRREIVHVHAEVVEDGEIIMFCDEDGKSLRG
jgi:hypothetical protein